MRSNTEAVIARRGRECRQKVHRQRVRLIRQLKSDDLCSQSLGLTEQSAEQHNVQLDFRNALCMEYHVCTSMISDCSSRGSSFTSLISKVLSSRG